MTVALAVLILALVLLVIGTAGPDPDDWRE